MTKNACDGGAISAPLILATTSPRRRQLMREYGYACTVIDPPFEDPDQPPAHKSPAKLAETLSHSKAQSAQPLVDTGIIISGDTIVALMDRIYGKPADRNDARSIISALAGTTHDVITGVTLLNVATGQIVVRHDSTAITMRSLATEELEAYLDTGAWAGKAGAYGIQDHGDAFVTKIEGSFTNVVGFPMELIGELLAGWGITPTGQGRTS